MRLAAAANGDSCPSCLASVVALFVQYCRQISLYSSSIQPAAVGRPKLPQLSFGTWSLSVINGFICHGGGGGGGGKGREGPPAAAAAVSSGFHSIHCEKQSARGRPPARAVRDAAASLESAARRYVHRARPLADLCEGSVAGGEPTYRARAIPQPTAVGDRPPVGWVKGHIHKFQ